MPTLTQSRDHFRCRSPGQLRPPSLTFKEMFPDKVPESMGIPLKPYKDPVPMYYRKIALPGPPGRYQIVGVPIVRQIVFTSTPPQPYGMIRAFREAEADPTSVGDGDTVLTSFLPPGFELEVKREMNGRGTMDFYRHYEVPKCGMTSSQRDSPFQLPPSQVSQPLQHDTKPAVTGPGSLRCGSVKTRPSSIETATEGAGCEERNDNASR